MTKFQRRFRVVAITLASVYAFLGSFDAASFAVLLAIAMGQE